MSNKKPGHVVEVLVSKTKRISVKMPVKVIWASFPKTGTKSLWRALNHLGYNHFDVPSWIDHMLDEWVSFMQGETSFDPVYQKFNELGGESFTDLPFNLYWEEFFKRDPTVKVILGKVG